MSKNQKKSKSNQPQLAHKVDSDTTQDSGFLNSINQRLQLQEQLMQHQNEKNPVQKEIQMFKNEVLQHLEHQILNSQKKLEEAITEEIEMFENSISRTLTQIREDHFQIPSSSVPHNSRDGQIEKIFKYKPSLLTDMLKQSDYKTLYHMIVASMFALMLNLWVQDYVERGIVFDMDTFFWCFQNPTYVCELWLYLVASAYFGVVWVHYCYTQKLGKFLSIQGHIIHQAVVILSTFYITVNYVHGFGSRMIVMCEAVRMMMKNYSYARNKMLYVSSNQSKNFVPEYWAKKGITEKNMILPDINMGTLSKEFSRFTYFFFAPTLLYRDHYVKAPHQSRRKVLIEFGNFFLCIYYGFILFRTFCKEPILQLRENLTFSNFITTIFKLMMPSTFSLVLVFFGLLHSWFNGWAELLRFPDRTFYLDWWTSSEFGQYYRKWNVVVHEFLYYYVYLDSDRLSQGKRSKIFSQFVTFGSSAIIHEIVLTAALGFFYPICFFLFTGPGILFINQGKKLTKKSWINIIFWLQIYLGTSIMITLYLTEYYARLRINDGPIYEKWGILQYVIPRTWYLIIGQ